MTVILVRGNFLIKLNGSRFFFRFVFVFNFFECQLFLVFGYVGVDNSSFLMKGMLFYFLTGAILVPVEIELVPRFGLLPSPLRACVFNACVRVSCAKGLNVCARSVVPCCILSLL